MNKKNPKGGGSESKLDSYVMATDNKSSRVILKSYLSD